jgi:glutathione synthase/RimK-type ligase-like ATP-grasp enzyme
VDKRYLLQLAAAGFDVVPTTVVDDVDDLSAALRSHGPVDVVVKPAVGAGSIDADRHREAATAREHVRRLLVHGRSALVQPYVAEIDQHGELDLVLIEGRYSHATRKSALLTGDAAVVGGLFREERLETVRPDEATIAFAERVVGHVAERLGTPIYARVDVVPVKGRPHLLELELVEPSLNHAHGPGSADTLARAVLARIGA